MKKYSKKSMMLICLLSVGFLVVGTGCTDKDFDLSNIDATIGIGGDGLELPVNSTENIVLEDILDLGNSDFVSIADNGDYIFSKDGGDCIPAHPFVERVNIEKADINNSFKLHIDIPSSALAARKRAPRRVKINDVSFEDKVSEFSFSGSAAKEIKKLVTASVSSDVSINVNLTPDLKSCITTFKTLSLTLPSYMIIDITSCSSPASNYTYDKNTGKITLLNVNTSSPIYIKGIVRTLDFTKKATSANKLVFTAGKNNGNGSIDLNGEIRTGVSFDEVNVGNANTSNLYLTASMSMGNIVINGAKGCFDPEINLGNLGRVDIGSVPDFLTGDDVKVNLYNPVIALTIDNNVPLAGKISGNIIAADRDGKTLASVHVPEMDIYAHTGDEGSSTVTRVGICKYPAELDQSKYDEVIGVSNLSDILRTIPNSIRFEADAKVDATKEAEIRLGHEYTIAPHYEVMAPLAFDEGAQIVYRDTLDGWNDDIKDLDFADGAYIELQSDIVNRLPAYLNVSAFAVDVDGNAIPDNRIEVVVSNSVKASEDGNTAVTTPIVITLKEKEKGALKTVDGLSFMIAAAASEDNKSIVGKTINSISQTLTATNIKVRLVGRIIADLN